MKRILLSLLTGILPTLVLLVVMGNWLANRRTAFIDRVKEKEPIQSTLAAPSKSLEELWKEGVPVFPIIQSMTADEAEVAFSRAARLESGFSRERIRQWTFDRWAEGDPTGALNAKGIYLPDEDRFTMISPLVQRWAVDDPDACREWLKRQENILSEDELESQSWEELGRSVHEVRNHYPPSERELTRAWELIENADEETYFNGGVTLDDEEVEVAWPLIHTARLTGEWESTMTRLLEMLPARPNGMIWPVIQQWLTDDFDAATNWIAALPPGQQRDDIIGATTHDPHGDSHGGYFDRERLWDWIFETAPHKIYSAVWNTDDLAAIAGWLKKHPADTPELESARYTFAKKLAEHDNEAAIAWAETLTNPARREGALRQIGRYWFRTEPWAATQWAQEALGWSEDECAENFGPVR